MNLTFEELQKAISSVKYQPWESKELDDFMQYNKDISKVMLATPDVRLKDVGFVQTKYGMLKVVYNAYLPPDTMYLMAQPPSLDDWLKPTF